MDTVVPAPRMKRLLNFEQIVIHLAGEIAELINTLTEFLCMQLHGVDKPFSAVIGANLQPKL